MSIRTRSVWSRCCWTCWVWMLLGPVGVVAGEVDALDWPNWRGPQQNRVSTETGLIDDWDPAGGEGSNLLWKRTDLAGRSSPVVFENRLYTIVRDQPATADEGEKVVCVDAATGETLWEYRFNVYLSDVPDERIGWSCAVVDTETSRVYVHGVCGYFCCLEGETGELVWERSLHEEFGLISTYGGRTNVPVIYGDTVITSAVIVGWGDKPKWGNLARPAHRFLAFDKATGEVRWFQGTSIAPFDTTYSTPTLTLLGDRMALVFGSGDGRVWALQPTTGKRIWNYPLSGMRGLNVSPLVDPVSGRVFVGHSEENAFGNTMGAVVALDGTKEGDLTGTELWMHIEVMAGKASPVLYEGRVYFVDDRGKLFIYDAETGEFIARKALGTSMRSTPLFADGKIYLCTYEGRWYILRPTEDGVDVVHRLRLNGESSSGSPAVSRGRIFFPTEKALYCLGRANHTPQAGPLPALSRVASTQSGSLPTQLQVVPYDVLLAPGESQAYRLRLFNEQGDAVSTEVGGRAEYSVDGPGSITTDGVYIAPRGAGHECALVTVRLGDLTGTARVRIVPPLPWKFDFNDADDLPLSWIGGRVRYAVREADGERFIAKKTVLPTPRKPDNKLGTRSFVWMGPTDLSNYTIQADVLLKEENGQISNVGLINSRYMLSIRGANSKLRLDTWTTSDYRTHQEVDFAPEPEQWYTIKLQVVPGTTQAEVRGKLWPRSQQEPSEWAVEMVDHSPNLHGTPGLYGKSPEAEIYIDNVIVTPN